MRVRRVWLFATALLLGCARGPTGCNGGPGLPGFPGTFLDSPRVDSVVPAKLSWGSVVSIQGRNFTADPTKNEVWVGGVKGDVLSANSTLITVTHLAPPDLAAAADADLVVASHNEFSNTVPVVTFPRGTALSIPLDVPDVAPRDIGQMLPIADGTLVLMQPSVGTLLDVSIDGDISFYGSGIVAGAFGAVDHDGIYYIAENRVRHWDDGLDYQVMLATSGTATALAFDATNNLYVAEVSGADTNIVKRDAVTGDVTPFFTATGFRVSSMTQLGGKLFVWGVGQKIESIDLATPALTPLTAAAVDGHSLVTDGTKLYIAENGLIESVDPANGTIANYSLYKATTGTVDQIAWFSGTFYYRLGNQIWRLPDANTFASFVFPIAGPRALGDAAFVYAGNTATCGTANSRGGVFYELHTDGTVRHVVSNYCGKNTLALLFGTFYGVNSLDGSIEVLSPNAGTNLTLLAGGTILNPLFVVADAQGNLYIPGSDGAGGYRVSQFDSNGALLAQDFVPSFSEAPAAGAVLGTHLILSFTGSRTLQMTNTHTGGALAAFGSPAFRPVANGLAASADGRLLLSDQIDGSLWAVAGDGSATLLGPGGGDETWFPNSDGSFLSVGTHSLDMVLP